MKAQEKILPIEGPGRASARQEARLGALLAEDRQLDAADIERVTELQRVEGLRFGEAAVRLGLISADDLRRVIAKQYGHPHLLPAREGVSSELVVAQEPLHPRAEELRALRTQLLIRWCNARLERPMLAVVSPGPGEGRSYVVANLAVAFSQLGQRTLLIDADLRTPRQHRIFNISDQIGLSTILSGRADHAAVVPAPEFGTLSLLPAGACPPNPQELLLRPAFVTLLDKLQTEFDVILFDTPPAHLYADAQSLAFRAGGALVLARKDRTRLEHTKSILRELSDMRVGVVGIAFNTF
jgi:chain length determinant protein tyrosine kinase EpsG